MSEPDLDSIVAEFEAEHVRTQELDVRRFLPKPESAGYAQVAAELVRVAMELSWAKGARRPLESFADSVPFLLSDPRILEPVAFEEYRLRAECGERVAPHEYQRRFPNVRTWHWPLLVGQSRRDREPQVVHNPSVTYVSESPPVSTESGAGGSLDRISISNAETVEGTLHRRLRFIALAIVLTLAYLAILTWQNPDEKVGLFLGSRWLVWVNTGCLLLSAIVLAMLVRSRQIRLERLRFLEFCLFGAILAELGCGLYSDLMIDYELARPLREGPHALFHYASSWTLPWFALIVAYGILVPSTWQRCLYVVGAFALLPLVIVIGASNYLYGLSADLLGSVVMQMLIWMLIAVATAVYGVQRLDRNYYRLTSSGRLGNYRLLRKIASGGMGEVYLAEHTSLNRRCAIKLIRREWSRHPVLARRFDREIQALAALSHPNIVHIQDFGMMGDGTFYFVMEYLEGTTLHQLVRDHGPFERDDAIAVLAQIADALGVLHRAGIVHRDVKPGNVFMVRAGGAPVAKLLDFGLVKSISVDDAAAAPVTIEGEIIGTPAYMSPEQAAGRCADARTDIYSLAAVGWYALTGSPVFDFAAIAEIMAAHISASPATQKTAARIPDDLRDVFLRCLAKDPDSRFQTAAEFAAALRACAKSAREPVAS